MVEYKIKFVTVSNGEEHTADEYPVTVHQYMKIHEQVRKLKGVR